MHNFENIVNSTIVYSQVCRLISLKTYCQIDLSGSNWDIIDNQVNKHLDIFKPSIVPLIIYDRFFVSIMIYNSLKVWGHVHYQEDCTDLSMTYKWQKCNTFDF